MSTRDSVPYIPRIFEIFKEYGDTAPKSLADVPALEEQCRKQGRGGLAEELFEWRVALQYRIEAEFTEPPPMPVTDTFERTVDSGWGTGDAGSTWTEI